MPTGRPVLIVANHFNGFVDPLVITSALGRLPRFIAKVGLSRFPVVGFLLRRAGRGVRAPAGRRRPARPRTPTRSPSATAPCAERDVVAIFPEGTTHDRPRMEPLKTGAARIALGARAAGADGLAIVPIGLTFPDKVALRSSALVQVGEPIDARRGRAGGRRCRRRRGRAAR